MTTGCSKKHQTSKHLKWIPKHLDSGCCQRIYKLFSSYICRGSMENHGKIGNSSSPGPFADHRRRLRWVQGMLIGIVFGSYYAIQSRVGEPVTLWTQVRKAIQTAAETRTAKTIKNLKGKGRVGCGSESSEQIWIQLYAITPLITIS